MLLGNGALGARALKGGNDMANAVDDPFALDPTGEDIRVLSSWLSGEGDGDTTGDGCGESPPQGPTTGC